MQKLNIAKYRLKGPFAHARISTTPSAINSISNDHSSDYQSYILEINLKTKFSPIDGACTSTGQI